MVYLFIVWRNDHSQRLCRILEKHVHNDISTNILFLLFEYQFIDNISFGSGLIGYFSPSSASLRGTESLILFLFCVNKEMFFPKFVIIRLFGRLFWKYTNPSWNFKKIHEPTKDINRHKQNKTPSKKFFKFVTFILSGRLSWIYTNPSRKFYKTLHSFTSKSNKRLTTS